MFGTSQPKMLAEFYEKIFARKPDMIDGDWTGWQVGSCFFSIGSHSEIHDQAKEPARIILNFETKETKKEFERIRALGATVIKEPYETTTGDGYWIATFADPDGNYFQLMPPWENS